VAVALPPAASVHTVNVSEYSIFYEFVDGELLRRMQPIEVSYFRCGTGDAALLCLHSLSMGSRVFGKLAGALNGPVEVVAPDLRGFGRSHRPTHEYSVDLWVDDIVGLVREVGAARPFVYGHGLGACVALGLAARAPVAGLALSGVAFAPGEPAALDQVIEIGERGEDVSGTLEALVGVPAVVEDLTPQIVARAARAWQAFDGRPLATLPDTPLLVLAAEDDALAPPDAEGGPAQIAALNNSALVRLADGSELPATLPEVIAERLLDWVNDGRGEDGQARR
jgi:pimeloyl-ACP methyl ester carboxylesterase